MKLNLRAIDLNLLTIFDAIMVEGQMSKAAERLHMTQPAASHALKRLRQTFDDELFIRTRQGMKPTPRALEIAEPIKEALALVLNTLNADQPFDPALSDRPFKIAFGRYGELILLPQILNKVNEVETAISIHSYLDDQATGIDLVKEGNIDFCFDFVMPEDARLDFCLFSEQELVVIARNKHPRLTDSISLEQYFSERHVVMSFGSERRERLQQFMSEQGGTRKILAEVNQYIAAPTVVMQTDGIATVPRQMAEFFLYQNALTVLPLPFEIPALPIYLIWHKGMNRDKGHQWLKQLIQAC